jgi:hypothetical protein
MLWRATCGDRIISWTSRGDLEQKLAQAGKQP